MAERLKNRNLLAITGYGLSAVGKVLFVVATSWIGILWGVSERYPPNERKKSEEVR